jgi:hypothetical protein
MTTGTSPGIGAKLFLPLPLAETRTGSLAAVRNALPILRAFLWTGAMSSLTTNEWAKDVFLRTLNEETSNGCACWD